MATDYEMSNKTTSVRLNSFRKDYASDFLKCGENNIQRQVAAQALLKYLCDKFRIHNVTLCVSNQSRPIKGRVQIGGLYYPTTMCIVIYNTTAKTRKPISIKAFFGTLLHEFIHHYDFEVLRLNSSPHTTGFYKRIADLKEKIS